MNAKYKNDPLAKYFAEGSFIEIGDEANNLDIGASASPALGTAVSGSSASTSSTPTSSTQTNSLGSTEAGVAPLSASGVSGVAEKSVDESPGQLLNARVSGSEADAGVPELETTIPFSVNEGIAYSSDAEANAYNSAVTGNAGFREEDPMVKKARLAEIARIAEEKRLAEVARLAELARLEEERLAEIERQRLAELARLEAERIAAIPPPRKKKRRIGTHCCTASMIRSDITLTEVKKLRVWHRKQSKIWQEGYDVWGKIIADLLISEYDWCANRAKEFYDYKIHNKITSGAMLASFVIYTGSYICGSYKVLKENINAIKKVHTERPLW